MIARSNLMIDMLIIKEASGGKVQKHIGKGERSCCWTCGALDPHNSSLNFRIWEQNHVFIPKKLMIFYKTRSVTQRYEASLPGGGADGVVPLVGANSYTDPAGLEIEVVEVSSTVTANFWP
ncbi:hypothetical protein BT93_C0918 [Corymbia citriodora subsp. variegata]|nr:hypothetical protein BT93_C0918 [Corymbia citriodora subsp. variegata]